MTGHDREVRRTRAGYVGALRGLAQAMTAFELAGVPLEPGSDGRIEPWTAEQQRVMRMCAQAWASVVSRRRAYDAALREANHPETRPYA